MKKGILFSGAAFISGIVGLFLRRWERQTGFEAETGLAVPGNSPALILGIFSALMAVVFLCIALKLKQTEPYFWYDRASLTEHPLYFVLYGIAALCVAVGGVLLCAKSLSGETMDISRLILGLIAIGTGIALLLTGKMNYKERQKGRYRLRLLVPAFFCCYWLILAYEHHAANPVVLQYIYELFAIICVLLAFYYIAGFDFSRGRVKRALFCGYLGCYFSLTTLADGHEIETVLFYVGVSLYLLVYLASLLKTMEQEELISF